MKLIIEVHGQDELNEVLEALEVDNEDIEINYIGYIKMDKRWGGK